jgi:TolB-like protein/Tfp pilus assembly protein PilF
MVVYLIVAWAMIQVADTVVPNVGLPQWTVTLVILLTALGLPIAIVLAWLYDITPSGVQRAPVTAGSSSRAVGLIGVGMVIGLVGFGAYWRVQPRADKAQSNSIVVLPFVDMSPAHDQEYLGDGITEEILNALAQVDGLRVPARTTSFAFKGKDIPVREIAHQLGVVHVLEGSVRKQGDMVRITAQLIDARSDKHLWSETFDRKLDDVFAVQEQITKAIVDALKLHLGEAQVVDRETASGRAHEQYLKGLYYWNRRRGEEMRVALKEFEEGTKLDPNYARPWAGLALTYAILPQYVKSFDPAEASRKGREAAARALKLDPKAADAHAALSQIAQELDWDWQASLRHADEAVKLDPKSATAHQWRAEILMILRRCDDALSEADRSLEIDPLSSVMHNVRGLVLQQCGQTRAAYEEYKGIIKRDPEFALGNTLAFDAAVGLGLYDEALRIGADSLTTAVVLALKDPARRPAVLRLLGSSSIRAHPPLERMFLYEYLGEVDSMMVLLDRATNVRVPNVGLFIGGLEPYEKHPLYEPLMRKLKYPQ